MKNINKILLVFILLIILLIVVFSKENFTRNKGKVIASCYAGRKHNMEILLKYIDILLQRKYIDEFHIWNFTRNNEDNEYIKSLRTKYKVFEVADKIVCGSSACKSYYEHYFNILNDDDIIVKIDDDILYIDVDTFPDYINERRTNDCLVLSANVINNSSCAYYQQQNGLLPTSLHTFTYYPKGGGKLLHDGVLGTKVHKYFIDNLNDITTKAKNLGVVCVPIGDRHSINFIALRGKEIKLVNFVRPDRDKDDELFWTVIFPKEVNKPCCIYMKFIVAHAGFFTQYESGLNDKYVASLYSNLL